MRTIKKILKASPIYILYRKIMVLRSELYALRVQKYMQKYGLRDIFSLQQNLQERGVLFFFDFGTLLGLYRDGTVIKGDMDVDIGVIVDSMSDVFFISQNLHDFKKIRKFSTETGIVAEESFLFNKYLRFDIHYYYKRDNKRYCYLFYRLPERQYPSNIFDAVQIIVDDVGITSYIIDGRMLNVPTDPERFLIQKYGQNWRIPDSGWVYWEGPNSIKVEEKGCIDLFVL